MTAARRLLILTIWLLSATGYAQDGSVDMSFNPQDTQYAPGTGANSTVYVAEVAPSGKIYIGGMFAYYDGIARSRVARLNADGTLDQTFNAGTVATTGNDYVITLGVQSDGRVLIGGYFSGPVAHYLFRALPDGSIDTSFHIGSGPNARVQAITIQPDGRILIAGCFTQFNGTAAGGVVRLMPTGDIDPTFNVGSGSNSSSCSEGVKKCIEVLSDGRIMLGGSFTTFNGAPHPMMVRLLDNGAVDPTFDMGGGAGPQSTSSCNINSIVECADGKLIIGGNMTTYNGTQAVGMARLMPNGALDNTFNAGGAGFSYAVSSALTVYDVKFLTDGRLMAVGQFDAYNGATARHYVILNADGSQDMSFSSSPGSNNANRTIALQPDGKFILGGAFSMINNVGRHSVARLNANGTVDMNFDAGSGVTGTISAVRVQPDGKTLICGAITAYNNVPRHGVARLLNDGTLDPSFDPGTALFGGASDIALQSDGKIVVVGPFCSTTGSPRDHVARLNTDGSLDATFSTTVVPVNGVVNAVLVQPDGAIVIGGNYIASGFPGIRRITATGAADPSFTPGYLAYTDYPSITATIYALNRLQDGRILMGGIFTNYAGAVRHSFACLNSDGSLANGSIPMYSFAIQKVESIAIHPDGSIFIGGNNRPTFSTIGRLWKLNADLSYNTQFTTVQNCTSVRDISCQPDGRVVIAGNFSSIAGISRNGIARLFPDGNLDPSFDPGTGAVPIVEAMAIEPGGKVIIAGLFSQVNGIPRNGIARLMGTARSNIRVMLEGPFAAGLMNDALRTLSSFPLTEPFTAMGYAESAYVPGATIGTNVLATIGNDAIVDWVIVEMRPAATPNVISASRAVLLQRDGDIVDLDGVSSVGFAGLAHGDYCVAVKPRTHLPVMLSPATPFAYGTSTAAVDFTLPSTQVYDADARKNVGGVMVLATGDASFNEELKYVGNGNDRDPILLRVGGSTPSATVSGYWPEDVNMDGAVKYTGANNDRDPILVNIGGSTPNAVRNAQLP